MNKFKKILIVICGLCISSSVNAVIMTYDILNLSNQADPPGTTYSGDGYVGMYAGNFNGIFGIEFAAVVESRTALNVDVSALSGAVINSARLEYTITRGSGTGTSQTIELTAFTANGTLEHFWDAPDNLLSQSYTSNHGGNSLDVTNLLVAGLATNTDWFGLHLQSADLPDIYQWTLANAGGDADAAQVNLIVDYALSVPEPSILALLSLGLLGIGVVKRTKI